MVVDPLSSRRPDQHTSYVSVACHCPSFRKGYSRSLSSCGCRPNVQPNNWPAPFICFYEGSFSTLTSCVSRITVQPKTWRAPWYILVEWQWRITSPVEVVAHCTAEYLSSNLDMSWLRVNVWVSVKDLPIHSPVVLLGTLCSWTPDQRLPCVSVVCPYRSFFEWSSSLLITCGCKLTLKMSNWPVSFICFGCVSVKYIPVYTPVVVVDSMWNWTAIQHHSYVWVACQCFRFCEGSSSLLGSCDCSPTLQLNNWLALSMFLLRVSVRGSVKDIIGHSQVLIVGPLCSRTPDLHLYYVSVVCQCQNSVKDLPVQSPVVVVCPMCNWTPDQHLSSNSVAWQFLISSEEPLCPLTGFHCRLAVQRNTWPANVRSSSALTSCGCRPTVQQNNWPGFFKCFVCVSVSEVLWRIFYFTQLWSEFL